MTESEFLARWDRRLERMDEQLEHLRLQNERMDAKFDLQAERHNAMQHDLRQFMREITLRVERGGREMVKELRELQAETQAQTQAILTVIDRVDRLDPGGSAA